VCSRCNRATGFGEPGFDPGDEVRALYDEIAARVAAPAAVRACDDPDTWDWRAFVKARREHLAASS
jgi:hypothetical protein